MEQFNAEAKALVEKGINPIGFPGLKLSITSDDSKAINFDQQPKVILSASGMCEAGRIRHHLKHNLWRPESTIVFVGYQTRGTLGRALLEGAKEVKLFGEVIEVKAEITKIAGISGHADKNGLTVLRRNRPNVYLSFMERTRYVMNLRERLLIPVITLRHRTVVQFST